MELLSMCRVCLATNMRLCSIARSLQHIYERLTEMTFKRDVSRPLVVCYICHARLQNCYRLWTSCIQSEELLIEMQSKGMFIQPEVSSTNTFSVTPPMLLGLGPVPDSTECHVKEEIPELTCIEIEQLNTEGTFYYTV